MGKINFKPRTIFCRDNLDVLRGINSACIDLIYLDPPFNKNKVFAAPIGSSAEGAEFSDIFREEDVKDEWVKSIEYENAELHSYLAGVKTFGNRYNYCYLAYMAVRLIECRRVLKDTGSVYLHCDPTMSHYLKIVLDCVFGERNFRNEVVWHYYNGSNRSHIKFGAKHDVVLFYVKGPGHKFNYNAMRVPYAENSSYAKGTVYGEKGLIRGDKRGKLMHDVWRIPSINNMAKERTGYPTQKPLALMERIVKASSKRGGMVLDPFCGCATTCVAAEKLGRNWIGVDVSQKAYELVNKRLKTVYAEQGETSATHPLLLGKYTEAHFTTTPPARGKDEAREQGYVYVIGNTAYPKEWKVGIAKDPEKRLMSYQTGDPKRGYTLADRFKTPHFREVERAVHAHFRAENEWVTADSAREVKAAIRRIAKSLAANKKQRGN